MPCAFLFHFTKSQGIHFQGFYCIKDLPFTGSLSFVIYLIGPVKPVCPEGMFTCADNQCIPQARRCDNRQDCRDNTDESVATCG